MSDDTTDRALVTRLEQVAEHYLGEWGASTMAEAADALARRIAEGERLKRGVRLFLENVNPAMFDADEAFSEVGTSQVDTLAALAAEESER